MPPRIALVGIGGFARVYLKYLLPKAREKQIVLSAAVVRSPEKYPEEIEQLRSVNCRIVPDTATLYREMTDKIDLVAIPTGIDTHCAYTCEALAHGCNVLVEKPAAGTVMQVREMIQAEAASGGRWVMVGFQHMCAPEIQELKKRLVAKEFGRLEHIIAMGRWPRANAYYERNNWVAKNKTASGAIVNDSPANNAFAHYLNISLFLAGKNFESPAHTLAIESKLFRARPIETFDTCDLDLETDTGVYIRALFTHACSENCHPKIKLKCENATIIWSLHNSQEGYYEVFDSMGVKQEQSETFDSFPSEFDTLIAKCRDPKVFAGTLNEALAHTRTIEMLHEDLRVTDIPAHEVTVLPDGQRVIHWVNEYFDNVFNGM